MAAIYRFIAARLLAQKKQLSSTVKLHVQIAASKPSVSFHLRSAPIGRLFRTPRQSRRRTPSCRLGPSRVGKTGAVDAAENGHGDESRSGRHDDSGAAYRGRARGGGNACSAGHDVTGDDRTDRQPARDAHPAPRSAELATRSQVEAAPGTGASPRAWPAAGSRHRRVPRLLAPG